MVNKITVNKITVKLRVCFGISHIFCYQQTFYINGHGLALVAGMMFVVRNAKHVQQGPKMKLRKG